MQSTVKYKCGLVQIFAMFPVRDNDSGGVNDSMFICSDGVTAQALTVGKTYLQLALDLILVEKIEFCPINEFCL